MSKDLIQALESAKAALSIALSDVDWRPQSPTQSAIHKAYCNAVSALSRHRSSVESVELDARRYRLLRDFDSADTELAICRWSEHGWCGEWVIEHDPDTEVDKALAKRKAR